MKTNYSCPFVAVLSVDLTNILAASTRFRGISLKEYIRIIRFFVARAARPWFSKSQHGWAAHATYHVNSLSNRSTTKFMVRSGESSPCAAAARAERSSLEVAPRLGNVRFTHTVRSRPAIKDPAALFFPAFSATQIIRASRG
ncbi:MAG TPA: hypothetical protein VFC78_22555 [Tepidisphaeraceae bacterium]|nr:hypothetical protein [Tepidisphaeraceae bacterium]